jgi:hypothetical protein
LVDAAFASIVDVSASALDSKIPENLRTKKNWRCEHKLLAGKRSASQRNANQMRIVLMTQKKMIETD